MKFSLFRSGWGPRVGAAVVYAALAFGTVAVVTRPDSSLDETDAQNEQFGTAEVELVSVRIVIESVRPVSQWTVRNAGVIISPQIAGATSWESEIRCAAIDLSIVTASEAGNPTNALRVRLETETRHGDFTLWCRGDCAFSLTPDEFPLSGTENLDL